MKKVKRNNYRSAQVILFVFFLLILSGILVMGLQNMWQSEIQTRTQGREGLKAFYIAQAGVEYAKMRLANQESWVGGGPFSFGDGTFNVAVRIEPCPVGCGCSECRNIESTGKVYDSQGAQIAERKISVNITLDKNPNDPPDTPGDEQQLDWSWQEF